MQVLVVSFRTERGIFIKKQAVGNCAEMFKDLLPFPEKSIIEFVKANTKKPPR